MVYEDSSKSYASSGVGTAALTTGIIGTALGSGILNNGLGGLFGGGNPTASAGYQLAQKDALIAKLESERYTDEQNRALLLEIGNLKQRLAAIEVAEPLREQVLGERINGVQATILRLVQPMIPNANVAYPPPVPTVSVQNGTVTPATATQAA